jgi:hypothetical protein
MNSAFSLIVTICRSRRRAVAITRTSCFSRAPEFVALLCLRPDPKHPIYGRNQVVHRDAFSKE